MSRSNPMDNTPNPATQWFEWDGEHGCVRFFDKEAPNPDRPDKPGVYMEMPDGFTFILLDELSTIRGWNDKAGSGIYANEVRDTRQDVLVVKMFNGGIIAEGLYQTIKDRIVAMGGKFAVTCYMAYKAESGKLEIGAIRFKGAAFGEWVEFKKKAKGLYEKAVKIKGFKAGKKGAIKFRSPVFYLVEVDKKTNEQAMLLDKYLQTYLKGYLSRTRSAAAVPTGEAPQPDAGGEEPQPDAPVDDAPADDSPEAPPAEEDDVPF